MTKVGGVSSALGAKEEQREEFLSFSQRQSKWMAMALDLGCPREAPLMDLAWP